MLGMLNFHSSTHGVLSLQKGSSLQNSVQTSAFRAVL